MGRIAIFTDDPGWHGRQLSLAFAVQGFSCQFVSLTGCRFSVIPGKQAILIPGFEKTLPDAVFVRGVPGGSLEEVVLALDILHALQVVSVPVYNNARAIECSVDKAMTSFLLHQAGLPTPMTWVLRDRDQAMLVAVHELQQGYFLLSKPLFGSQGEGIIRIEKHRDLLWLMANHGVYYLQRFIHAHDNGFSDYRVFVINGKAVAAMRRRGSSWLTNVARGALCEIFELNPGMTDLAVRAAEVLALDYAGVDIIQDREGQYLVIEVNSIPAWKGLESVCEINIAELLVKDLIDRKLTECFA